MLTLYQAEWCPFSTAVRERLTELGIPFVAQQVEPYPEQRAAMLERTGTDSIPTLVTDDGQVFDGTDAIFPYLASLDGWEHADAHRKRYDEHRRAREKDTPGRLLEKLS
jgi:glutathione S-transferase